MREFANDVHMMRDGEWQSFVRFTQFIDALVALVHGSGELDGVGESEGDSGASWKDRVDAESREELQFPSSEALRSAGLYAGVQRYGGRRALGARLGFRRQAGGLFMGAFSPSFAVELVRYALDVAEPNSNGYLSMPRPAQMRADGREGLAELCERFGGATEVGRRLGLVPPCDEFQVRC